MKTVRGRGRPRKPADTFTAAQFGRDAKILNLYHHVRATGQKHSAAVAEVVRIIKSQNASIRISQSTVKRTLTIWRHAGLHFEIRVPTEKELKHQAAVRAMIAAIKNVFRPGVVPPLSGSTPTSPVLSIRFGARTIYPRHNGKCGHQ
jgi:hypothetical protein